MSTPANKLKYTTDAYTPEERAGIAAAFRAAKPHLWDGRSRITDISRYICIALSLSRHPGAGEAKRIIEHRLAGHASVNHWLDRGIGIDYHDLTPENVQDFRHRWLDALIAEFSA